ncbi:MAG: metallophosphoesterase [Verrucomicrobiota bacterium]
MRFLIFISIVLTVYTAMNAFILYRMWSMLKRWPGVRTRLCTGLTIIALLYPLGRVWLAYSANPASMFTVWLGSFWVVGIMYLGIFGMATLLVDTAAWLRPRQRWVEGWRGLRSPLAALAVVTTGLLMVFGYFNAQYPVVTELNVKLPPERQLSRPWKLAVMTDIHLGAIIDRDHLARLVDQVNELKPDAVVLVGDSVDSDMSPVLREDAGKELQRLRAPAGVYAVTGNHEFIGETELIVDYLESHGVEFLRDEARLVGGELWLVGREDRAKPGFTGEERKELADFYGQTATRPAAPVVVLDHQPKDVATPARLGADLMLSGHTHAGQLWPFYWLVYLQYEHVSGEAKIDDMTLYVLNGTGTWGPPVRVGNRPEILMVTLEPAGQ